MGSAGRACELPLCRVRDTKENAWAAGCANTGDDVSTSQCTLGTRRCAVGAVQGVPQLNRLQKPQLVAETGAKPYSVVLHLVQAPSYCGCNEPGTVPGTLLIRKLTRGPARQQQQVWAAYARVQDTPRHN